MRHLVFDVTGRRRGVPRRWWQQMEGPKPGESFTCNGCSCSPDYWRRRALWPACVIHDYHYRTGVLGHGWPARQKADAILRRNIQAMLRMQGSHALVAFAMGWVFWVPVRLFGWRHYRARA